MFETSEPYDPTAYPPVAVTVDLVLMTVLNGQLRVLLQRRDQEPFAGRLALPGSFVGPDEDLDAATHRVLAQKVGLSGAWLEQLYSFGDPARDPRMRIVSISYFALLPADRLKAAVTGRNDLRLVPVDVYETPLAFDHDAIVDLARARLQGKLAYTPVALALLPDQFTLRDLQEVHEAILATRLNKPAFRRRMLDSGWIEGTGEKETAGAFRPAELFRQTHCDRSQAKAAGPQMRTSD
ncbi:NUDIX hydrolase [Sphingobium yanoikuyae]|uniref:NUDIX hydrolase n=1 Tax=Sphingobium yanoikuyae TaxID=13690 RepID=UPI0028A72A48|nr:NUDIX domain-containing protein [Sphingobium yanoikuyae]